MQHTSKILVAVAGTAALVGGVVGGAIAATGFTDVPDTHPFADEISAVAGAGVAGGFPDGSYRPADAVTRQAMAAFLSRGLGRVGSSTASTALTTNDETKTVATVQLDPGGISGTGFARVEVSGDVTYTDYTEDKCPCTIEVQITDGSTQLGTTWFELPGASGQGDSYLPTIGFSDHVVVPIPGGTPATFNLDATMRDQDQTSLVVRNATITATYVPFGPDGDATLAYGD